MTLFRGRMAKKLGRRIVAGVLLTLTSMMVTGRVDATPSAPNQPDILVLVYAGLDGQDSVGLTYPTTVPHIQAKGDVQALAASTGWVPQHVNIEDATAPFIGSKEKMTSVDFVAHNVIPNQGGYLPLEPVVTALKNYPHVAITYMVGGNFPFQGLRQYSDRYVDIALDARGNAYTYHVHVLDHSFQKLNLPLFQPAPGQVKSASAAPSTHRVRPWQVMLVTLVACLAGGGVYFLMSRHAPA